LSSARGQGRAGGPPERWPLEFVHFALICPLYIFEERKKGRTALSAEAFQTEADRSFGDRVIRPFLLVAMNDVGQGKWRNAVRCAGPPERWPLARMPALRAGARQNAESPVGARAALFGQEGKCLEDLFAQAPGIAMHGVADPSLHGLMDGFVVDEAGVVIGMKPLKATAKTDDIRAQQARRALASAW